MPAAHATCLAMLEPVMTMREGAAIYAPDGMLLREGGLLQQPGLVNALELLRDEGCASVYTGTIAERLLALSDARGGVLARGDLLAYEALWSEPVDCTLAGRRLATRSGLSGVPEAISGLDRHAGADGLLAALEGRAQRGGSHTTNITVVDAEGNACVITTSLGLGSGDFLPGLDLHLNSMLGETDLITAPLAPGDRMQSMMAPTLGFDGRGLELAIGAAGGTRLRTALAGVLSSVLHDGLEPQAAIDKPRFHPADGVVHAEPGVDPGWLAGLEQSGRSVRRWPALHHYFGGVSAVGRAGAGADPRRSGAVRPAPAR